MSLPTPFLIAATVAVLVGLIPGPAGADLDAFFKKPEPAYRWEKQGDGSWQATVVVVGRDGITPGSLSGPRCGARDKGAILDCRARIKRETLARRRRAKLSVA